MKYHEYIHKLDQLKDIVENDFSGSPKKFSYKLKLSERTLLRMVQQLKNDGFEVIYDRKAKTYRKK